MAQQVKNPPSMQETQEMRVRSLGWEYPLEKEMAIHSSLLAWEISWRKKPGELQSMILQKVGLNLGSKPPPPSFIFYIWLMVSKLVHSAYIHLPFFLSNYLIFQITHFFIIKTPPLDIQTT